MPGDWLLAIARRLIRDETFERMVSPAIADLQFEAATQRTLRRCVNHVAVWRVLLHALVHDFVLDVGLAFDAGAWRRVWSRAGLWYAGFSALFAWIALRGDVPWALIGPAERDAALTSALLRSLIAGSFPAMVAAAFYLSRRGVATTRTITAAALVVAAVTLATALAVRPFGMSANRALYETAHPLIEDGRPGAAQWATWLQFQADEVDEGFTRWRAVRSAVSIIPAALIGIVLARRRGWMVPVTALLFWASAVSTWVLVVMPLERTLAGGAVPSRAQQDWRTLALNLATAIVWLALGTPAVRRAAAAMVRAAAERLDPPHRNAT